MFKVLETTEKNILAIEAVGKITADDYVNTLHPLLEKCRVEGDKLNFLFYFGPEFEGYTMGASWEDSKLGFKYLNVFEKIAVVSDTKWVNHLAGFFGSMMPQPVKVFPVASFEDAKLWLAHDHKNIDFHFDILKKILKIDIKDTLSSSDFDALSHFVDPWIEKHGDLHGIILHVEDFPHWENIGSFISHLTFVKNHHQKIKKIALCIDNKTAEVLGKIASHFISAEIKQFSYDEVSNAKKWIQE